jgi:hypothetical protein
MSRPENSTTLSPAQALVTKRVELLETPISNQAETLLLVETGMPVKDALLAAQRLSSGVNELCLHLYDDINANNSPVFCNSLYALRFLSETVSALIAASRPAIESMDQQDGGQP